MENMPSFICKIARNFCKIQQSTCLAKYSVGRLMLDRKKIVSGVLRKHCTSTLRACALAAEIRRFLVFCFFFVRQFLDFHTILAPIFESILAAAARRFSPCRAGEGPGGPPHQDYFENSANMLPNLTAEFWRHLMATILPKLTPQFRQTSANISAKFQRNL